MSVAVETGDRNGTGPNTNSVVPVEETRFSSEANLVNAERGSAMEKGPYYDDSKEKRREGNIVAAGLARFWGGYDSLVSKHSTILRKCCTILVVVLAIIYIGAVIRQFSYNDASKEVDWCRGYGMAFILFGILTWTLLYYGVIVPYLFPYLVCHHNSAFTRFWRRGRVVVMVVLGVMVAAFLVWDTSSDYKRLISVFGLISFIAFGFIFSKHPTKVRWRTVLVGLGMQFAMGVLAIRWGAGRRAFKCVGELAEDFLEYSYIGASVVYGDRIVRLDAVFAFQALSAIFFVSMLVQVLFYLGWMQLICLKLGWLVQVTMGTTVMESVNAVSSVFLGMTEAPLLYKPYIKDLTPSEIHAVMAGGFSTIAGTVFAAYASFGVDPAHIITASMMTAPAALCYSKLVYPEDTQSKTDAKSVHIYKSEDKSLLDAAVQGATVGIGMVQGIVATVIAMVSLVAFLNAFLQWLGLLAGVEDFTIETILAYLLFPVVWIMGVDSSQCLNISRLIGIKISVNEFIAYVKLGELKKTGVLSARTEAIATYALCSFANPGSVGILVSTLTTLCPAQRDHVIAASFRAFVSAVIISFLTACIAGALMPEEGFTD